MLKTRILTALVGIPAMLGLAYLGGPYWQLFVLLLAMAGLFEFYAMVSAGGHRPIRVLGYLLVVLLLAWFTGIPAVLSRQSPASLLLGMMVTGLVLLRFFPRYNLTDLAVTWFGPLYLSVFLSYALIAGELDGSFRILLLAFLLTWASDSGGYFVGRWLGRRKLAPTISPNKTWAGAAGGIFLAVMVAVLYGWGEYPVAYTVLLGVAGSITAQVGDLVVSAMKRHCGVKDTGSLIPGHGGVLDRFDSFMWVMPLVYYFCKYF